MPPAPAAAVAAPAAGGGDQADAPAQPNPIFGLLRMLAVWWLFRSFFSGGGGGGKSTSQLARSDYFLPLMQRSTPVDVAMVLSEERFLAPGWLAFGGEDAGAAGREGDAARVVWRQSAVPLAATSAESKVTVSYTPSEVRVVDFTSRGCKRVFFFCCVDNSDRWKREEETTVAFRFSMGIKTFFSLARKRSRSIFAHLLFFSDPLSPKLPKQKPYEPNTVGQEQRHALPARHRRPRRTPSRRGPRRARRLEGLQPDVRRRRLPPAAEEEGRRQPPRREHDWRGRRRD